MSLPGARFPKWYHHTWLWAFSLSELWITDYDTGEAKRILYKRAFGRTYILDIQTVQWL